MPATTRDPEAAAKLRLLRTLKAVQRGDFSTRMPVFHDGILTEIAETLNLILDQNEKLTSQIREVTEDVGKEGKINRRVAVAGLAGDWAALAESVNSLIADATQPTRDVLRVLGAVVRGDLSQQMPLKLDGRRVKGAFREKTDVVNGLVLQLRAFTSEVTRVAREVGTEGKLGGQAKVGRLEGVWKDLTSNVNLMAFNLTSQVRNIALVTTAVANGDLSRKITVEVKGEILQLKDTINTMVDQLRSFAAEVTRVARQVGTEGKLGVQAEVKEVAGVWKDLTDNVNFMASNLTSQVRNIAEVTKAVAQGDLSKKITVDVKGEILELKDTINIMVDQLNSFASEVTRVAREVGTEGKLGGQAQVKGVAGVWKDLTDNVNFMASNLTGQVRNIAEVTTAVANGDLSRKITVEVKGEILQLKDTINTMVDQLRSFASEVIRVAREVGFEGKLGGQADVKGVAGVWKDLTTNVNLMASNLTGQVRNIAEVTKAVANGDLSKQITVDVRGEILELKSAINTMVDQLNSFASEVTRVAREVGTQGKLGGQARVKGVAGVWKDLTNNVNLMASNLTDQVRNINEVTQAIARGDLSKKITVKVEGEILALKNTINTMVDQLNRFASETTRVAREVGTEGRLGGQARVKGVAGVWKDLTNNVNLMARNITAQVRGIAKVNRAIAKGDLSKKMNIRAKGEMLQLKKTINTTVDLLNAFASEVTRVAKEVGTEGKLGGQAKVPGVAGVWRHLTNNVNLMASNLTGQVRNVADVTKAVAQGDLSKKITADVKGEMLELKNTINIMVDQLNSFASEVTRVAREVGTEGKLGGQARVRGVAGVWKDLTDNVNFMAMNLTGQVRNIAEVTTAVARGDLSRKITVEVRGEILQLKDTINTMVDQLRSFAAEVIRVAREVGFDGKLGGQADVKGVAGVWKDLTTNVNLMASNLTSQVRNIADVTTAVANGDLSRKITVEVRGEILQLKVTVNTMVDQLRSFAAEVTRVAREVGTFGKLGGQAQVKDVAGVWKDLTDNVNLMASNLTAQVRNIADVTTAVARGDLSKKITVDVRGEILELKNTINTMVDQLNSFASEVTRVSREVGTEGKLGGQAYVRGVAGVWKNLTDSVNSMASNLTSQVRNIADVTTAVAKGDLSRKITVKVRGEILQLKNTVNVMVDQLNSFASEVTRVAREVGTEGKLGGQAKVKGVAGVWKDLTDNVNGMAFNLTTQVRRIAKVVTAVANGNLKQKLPLEARGEIADLTDTINGMIDTLATFAAQVTDVAREVGAEGKLGGQARVPGATGIWRTLTDNVNQLAANLTGQVRAIAEVSTSVTKGDLTRSISVQAHGEVATLKDNINQMISNLRETTRKNAEQDWLKTNLARFGRMLQGERDLDTVSKRVLSELVPLVSAQMGIFYYWDDSDRADPHLQLLASWGYRGRPLPKRVALGDGLVGQCAADKKTLIVESAPASRFKADWVGLDAKSISLVVSPVPFEGEIKGVVVLGSFTAFSEIHQIFIEQLVETIGIVINTIVSTTRTEALLSQSQRLAEELQSRQGELQRKNEELEDKAKMLSAQKKEVEAKNREIELARKGIEEKAEQLAMTSRYKSQFLANMSHELRTPLNSLLILARTLAENIEGNLSGKQVEFAQTIQSSGRELLTLINDILDLSKIESGTMSLDLGELGLRDIKDYVERNFRAIAEDRRLNFTIDLEPGLPSVMYTDGDRLKQILRNLLSNALKFTPAGQVALKIGPAASGWSPGNAALSRAKRVIAFSVVDSGIGIPKEKLKTIFEAFQQVDMTTSRKYGGTGLGLSISRQLASLLDGEIQVQSELGEGSSFTLYVPHSHGPMDRRAAPRNGDDRSRPQPPAPDAPAHESEPAAFSRFRDDRDLIRPEDRVLLVIEPDAEAADSILKAAHAEGFKVMTAFHGVGGLGLAIRHLPHAVMLDLELPDIDGHVLIDRLKHDARTRHIPVYVLSSAGMRERAIRQGAFGAIAKPLSEETLRDALKKTRAYVERDVKDVLIVEEDEERRNKLAGLLNNGHLKAQTVARADEAIAALKTKAFDCVVVECRLPDMTGVELVERIHADFKDLPVVVDASKGIAGSEESALRKEERVTVVKDKESPARLVDAVALYVHQEERGMPEAERRLIASIHMDFPTLEGRTVLVVDDDVRNIFALTSVLEAHGLRVFHAESALAGLALLDNTPGIEAVLMDIMMPDIDGYEAIRRIRANPKLAQMPVIALTAKALKGDREKCLEAGASDYIPKPVEVEQLLSALRVHIYR